MLKKTKMCRALMLAFGGTLVVSSGATLAQTLERVEITGSAIKRIDAETSVPVTIVKIEELKAQGVTSVEQIMASLSAVQMTQGSSQQVGSGTGGAAFADLRGVGPSKTLVLLNGRRIANNAIDGSAPDLNMIPFASLERVEVLRDGASSLYGTDAIGGVINFITRKDFQGGSLTIGADKPKEKGGKAQNANIGFGFGDLAGKGFNVFGFVDMAKTDPIAGDERPFNARFPGGISPTTAPGNYFQGGAVGNPAAPGCPSSQFLVPVADGTSCQYATANFVDYTAKTERISGMLRGNLRVAQDHNLSAEWFYTRNEATTRIAPVPYGGLFMNPRRPDGTLNPFYPGNPGAITPNIPINPNFVRDTNGDGVPDMTVRPGVTLQPGYLNVRWRTLAGGSRSNTSLNEQQRFLVGMDGVVAGWDYQAGISYNENKIKETVAGYSDGNKITQGVLNGILNPFGAQDAAGEAFFKDALLGGNLQNHRGKVTTFDARISRELGDWLGSGRNVAVAFGGEFRKEDFLSAANKPVAELLQASTGVDPDSLSQGTRNITAFYSELNIPVTKQLDITAAFRYDKYSDFGNTTNPKIGIRFQPTKELLLRASYSTGFRAPSLYELNALQSYTNTGTVSDPVNCPDGKNGINGKPTVQVCQVQFQRLTGGNKSLQPEKSKNLTFGVVFEPTANLSAGIDLWWLRLTNSIAALSETTVLGDPVTFAQYIKRTASGNLSTDGFACPGTDCGYLDLRQQNLGGINTNGADLSLVFRQGLGSMGRLTLGLNSTYVAKYEYQDFVGGPWNQNVGVYIGVGPIFRWQHAATANWAVGNFTVGAVARYKSGYIDQDPTDNPRVSAYATLDTYVTWKPAKQISLTFGVTNLTDRDPPYSNQGEVFQANYDPRFTDPTGRKYYLRGSYQF